MAEHKAHMYGISERIIKKIILECLDDQLLFDKIKDEMAEFVQNGGLDSELEDFIDKKLSKMKDEILARILDDEGLTDDIDSFKEVAKWISEHGEAVNELVKGFNDKLLQLEKDMKEEVENLQADYERKFEESEKKHNEDVATLQKQIEELSNNLSEFKKNNFAVGYDADVVKKIKSINKKKIDAMFGGMGINFV